MAGAANDDIHEALMQLVDPHIASVDWFYASGIGEAVSRLEPLEVTVPAMAAACASQTLRVWLEDVRIEAPRNEDDTTAADSRCWPRFCRENGTSYLGNLMATVCRKLADGDVEKLPRRLGAVPVMVRSSLCHLRDMSPAELMRRGEEEHELGGYFICNGNEKIVRLLVQPRRNYVMALRRGAFTKRGPEYTDLACVVRCVRPDQSSGTLRVHYLSNGKANVSFSIRRQEFFIPAAIVLRALVEASDREIYEQLVSGAVGGPQSAEATFVSERAELLVQESAAWGLNTRAQALAYLGANLRPIMDLSPTCSDFAAGEVVMRDCVFVHLERSADKFALLIFMLHKLYALASGVCGDDNADSLMQQEVLLPGHLLTIFLKDKLQEWLVKLGQVIRKDLRLTPEATDLSEAAYFRKALDKNPANVGRAFDYLMATGNLNSRTGMDLSQQSGYTIVAEKLNFLRYISHFRSIHRGAYFMKIRTTTVRKLLPESWGFLCPVHTPDGSPCGLLSHLTANCKIVTEVLDGDDVRIAICTAFAPFGMLPTQPAMMPPGFPNYVVVIADGRLIGYLLTCVAETAVAYFRRQKEENPLIFGYVEIANIPYARGGPFPGIFLFSSPARFMRQVIQNRPSLTNGVNYEWIGSLEQAFMNIQCEGVADASFTHREVGPRAILSVVSGLTPWSDFNQSPRNMYQCQMAKQTMGVPLHSTPHRPDNKMFWLQTPQAPIAQTDAYGEYGMRDYPTGANAVVAVLAYTGYDMEDAMIINKSAMERGFAHTSMYKTEWIDLTKPIGGSRKRGAVTQFLGRGQQDYDSKGKYKYEDRIDAHGLPHIGSIIKPGEEFYSEVSSVTMLSKVHRLKGQDPAVVDQVTVLGGSTAVQGPQRAIIKLRYNRNPIIGDKFASRAGQKGVLSVLWPDIDMPFCHATGVRPDIIINPHAFPSRMTIGMMIESMAGKAGSLRGQFEDASPFQDNAGGAVEKYGRVLEKFGFNYHGSEEMTSGVTGCEFQADIYIGLVYYQRLRHMVSDKFQVRSVGPINNLTRQPVKGRKMGGGIRLGEMERDSLLAHGCAYLLHDRLHSCSDLHVADVCEGCGGILATSAVRDSVRNEAAGGGILEQRRITCRSCKSSLIRRIAMPYVFRYLLVELASMNVRVNLHVNN